MNPPLTFKNDSPEAHLAQKLLNEKFHDEFAKVPDGWDFAIDLDTLQTFSAQSPLEINERAKSSERIVTLALKVKGRDDWPWRIRRLNPRSARILQEFQNGNCSAHIFTRAGINELTPTLFRKVDSMTRALILAESPERLKTFNPKPAPGSEIRLVTVSDIREFVKKTGGRWVLEMLD